MLESTMPLPAPLPRKRVDRSWPRWPGLVFLVLAAVPVVAAWTDNQYLVTVVSRVLIFGLAAIGLNLVLGFGGLVSLGHAMYLGLGAYVTGAMAMHGISNLFAQVGVALLVGLPVAALIGLVCLRTHGLGFIMVTLAFNQMFYFIAVGLQDFGGDQGMPLPRRSAAGPLDLANGTSLYCTLLALLLVTTVLLSRAVRARFGFVLRGAKSHAVRMEALGFHVLPYRLVAYMISATVCLVAGILLANLTGFVSPSYAQWAVSGELVAMAVLGGMSTVLGPLVGAAIFIGFEEAIGRLQLGVPWIDGLLRDHWPALLGLFLIVVTLGLRNGLFGGSASKERP